MAPRLYLLGEVGGFAEQLDGVIDVGVADAEHLGGLVCAELATSCNRFRCRESRAGPCSDSAASRSATPPALGRSARAVKLATWELDPTFGEAEREAARLQVGAEGFDVEFGANFAAAGSGSVFDVGAMRWAGEPVAPEEGTDWRTGVDFGLTDLTGIAVVGRSREDPALLVTGALEALDTPRSGPAGKETLEQAAIIRRRSRSRLTCIC